MSDYRIVRLACEPGREVGAWMKERGAKHGLNGFEYGNDNHETVLIETGTEIPMYLPACMCGSSDGMWYVARNRLRHADKYAVRHARQVEIEHV